MLKSKSNSCAESNRTMSKGIIGKKLGMTSLFSPVGARIPVTVIKAGPCVVTQIKTQATDGYDALQLSFGSKKVSRINKPLLNHLKKSGQESAQRLLEFDVENPQDYQLGQTISLEMFSIGEKIDLVGTTKGRGFSGVIKRHGFHGGRSSHGSHSHRVPGSIGASAWPSRVFKGKKFPGQYGNTRQTVRNLEIVDILPEEHLILVKGAVPGPTMGIVQLNKSKLQRPRKTAAAI